MLVLTRKRDESIVLGPPGGDLVEVTVIDIRGDKVRLGIQVPREWTLHRKEVYEAIHQEEPPRTTGSPDEPT
jgi:carbon storage regulator